MEAETIQIVLDAKLRKAADVVAKRQKINRSALIRQALEEHLKRIYILDLEEKERRAYTSRPQQPDEYLPWDEVAAWPEE